MNILEELKNDIINKCNILQFGNNFLSKITLEIPKNSLYGDISTNIAILVAKKLNNDPKILALQFKDILRNISYIQTIEIAGPGFINFTIKEQKWLSYIKDILDKNSEFWNVNIGYAKKVNIEYVSANPTGPLHLGHSRGAVYGDVLANILQRCGYEVTREYYINDAGAQIDTLINSLIIRYKEAITKKTIDIPEDFYPGDYVRLLADKLLSQYGNSLLSKGKEDLNNFLKKFAITEIMYLIKDSLIKLGVRHDVFTSEKSLHETNKINDVIHRLTEIKLIYEGFLPCPKKKQGNDSTLKKRKQLLFRSSQYGDDKDRPMTKEDGAWTYAAADFAYAQDKIDRGFDILIYVLGTDHKGYIKRIKAFTDAVTKGKIEVNVITVELVNFIQDNQLLKMSKRKGNFIDCNDAIDKFSKDIIRLVMLTRGNDTTLDFDVSKITEKSKDNPVFYIKYAYVRAISILLKANNSSFITRDRKIIQNKFDVSLLKLKEEIVIIKLLSFWTQNLTYAASHYNPQKIVQYLINLSSHFHKLWNLKTENGKYRFIVQNDYKLTLSRLALVESVKIIIYDGLLIIGVQPIEEM